MEQYVDNDLLKRAFKMLQRYEGYLAGAAFRELHEPPFEQGPALKRLTEIRELLAEMQRKLDQS